MPGRGCSQQSVASRKRQWTAWTSPSTHQETATSSNFDSEHSGAGSSLAHRSFELEIMMLIKLNDKGVRAYMAHGRNQLRGAALDWQGRIGRVEKYSRNRSIAYVVWSGNRSCDRVSVRLIEPASAES